EDLNKLIKNNQDTPAGRDARLKLARLEWADAEPRIFAQDPIDPQSNLRPGRSAAVAKLNDAAKSFEELASEYGDVPVLAQECYLSAGKIYESVGNYEQALKNYNALA